MTHKTFLNKECAKFQASAIISWEEIYDKNWLDKYKLLKCSSKHYSFCPQHNHSNLRKS